MKRHWLLFLFAILLPLTAQATTYTPDGVGGGGRLLAGAINSNNPDIMVVGSDMMGVHRSTDGGANWLPWNNGIPDGEFRSTSNIQDLLYVDSPSWSGFFAASVGGAMRARDGENWQHISDPEAYNYFIYNDAVGPIPYPFSCLAFDGEDTVYIGAGQNKWMETPPHWTNALWVYPQLLESILSSSSHEDKQYTVWSYNLSTNGPLQPLTTSDNQFGAARDIGARHIDGIDYVVATTMTGIWLYDGTEWENLSEEVELYYDGQDRGAALDIDSDGDGCLWPWGAHITARGSLYISTIRNENHENSDLYPGGVYRIFDIRADLEERRFQWVGNDIKLPPEHWGEGGLTLREYGSFDDDDDDNYSAGHFIYMSVLDGIGDAPDEIYVGETRTKYGLFRIYQEYSDEELSCSVKHCSWTQWLDMVVMLHSDPYEYIDKGWKDLLSPGKVMFKPALAATDEGTRVLLQFAGRLHVSNDSGETFVNSYCTEADEGANIWKSKGYNELAVVDIEFDDDGRLLFGAGDLGNFYEDETYDSYYDYLSIPTIKDEDSDGKLDTVINEDDYAWTREGGYVTTVTNWRRTGQTALFAQKGGTIHAPAPSKLFMRHPDVYDGKWKNITSELDELDHYLFGDLIVVKDTTIFMAYKKYSSRYIGQSPWFVIAKGVLKGVYQKNGSWSWEEFSVGLVSPNWVFQLLYNPSSKRIFAATQKGLFVLDDLRDDDGWERVPGILDDYSNIISLTQSEKGREVFAGTSSGWDYSKTATLLKCTNPGADIADMQWQPMINTDSDDYHFEFGDDLYCLPEEMDGLAADEALPQLRAVAVRPGTDDTVFVGVNASLPDAAAFMPQEGVWVYNRRDCGIWENISLGTTMEGVGVRSLAFDPTDDNRLYIGTDGMGVQVLDLSTLPSISCTPEKPGKISPPASEPEE